MSLWHVMQCSHANSAAQTLKPAGPDGVIFHSLHACGNGSHGPCLVTCSCMPWWCCVLSSEHGLRHVHSCRRPTGESDAVDAPPVLLPVDQCGEDNELHPIMVSLMGIDGQPGPACEVAQAPVCGQSLPCLDIDQLLVVGA